MTKGKNAWYGVWTRTEWKMASNGRPVRPILNLHLLPNARARKVRLPRSLFSTATYSTCSTDSTLYTRTCIKSIWGVNGDRENIQALFAWLNVTINLRHFLCQHPFIFLWVNTASATTTLPFPTLRPTHPRESTKSINTRERDGVQRWRKGRIDMPTGTLHVGEST